MTLGPSTETLVLDQSDSGTVGTTTELWVTPSERICGPSTLDLCVSGSLHFPDGLQWVIQSPSWKVIEGRSKSDDFFRPLLTAGTVFQGVLVPDVLCLGDDWSLDLRTDVGTKTRVSVSVIPHPPSSLEGSGGRRTEGLRTNLGPETRPSVPVCRVRTLRESLVQG